MVLWETLAEAGRRTHLTGLVPLLALLAHFVCYADNCPGALARFPAFKGLDLHHTWLESLSGNFLPETVSHPAQTGTAPPPVATHCDHW